MMLVPPLKGKNKSISTFLQVNAFTIVLNTNLTGLYGINEPLEINVQNYFERVTVTNIFVKRIV
jgi:hypothetical protein